MKDVFIADAHLRDPGDENYRRFLAFLEGLRGKTRTLYLLGDIFEFWIGYRHAVFSAYVPVLEALRRLREDGTELVFVEGNHDFHMGPFFEEVLGCRVIADDAAVDVDGLRIYLAHGDLADPADSGYRLLRRLLHSRFTLLLARLVTPDLPWAISRWMGRQSRKQYVTRSVRRQPEELILAHARRRFSEGHQAVVTGHFHHPLLRSDPAGTVVALGDWIDQYSYAVLENGAFRMESA
ncbi:MAG TPA: UDP-2,3-diacylglucosamine diphosphatase [Deferrimonas sp.]